MNHWDISTIEGRMPLPTSHSRSRFYTLHRATFWVLLTIAFVSGLLLGGCIMTDTCKRAHEREERGTP